jgi:hypothetical protein
MRLESAAEAIDVLTTNGFRVAHEAEEPTHFDNTYVDLKRGNVLLRLVRERGRHFVELTAKGDSSEWFDVALVLRLLDVRELKPYGVDGAAVANLARHTVKIFDQIDEAFSRKRWHETVEKLNELQKRRWDERLASLST